MSQSQRLDSLQALRGIAALAVVVFHLRGVELKYLDGPSVLDSIGRYADAGVDLFFVLSGFVMTTICAGRYTRKGEGWLFLTKRAWRVLPLYWLFTTIVVVLMATVPSIVNTSYAEQSTLASYFLIPHSQLPLLTVGWTLVHEAYFYLVFAAVLAVVPERLVSATLLVWAGLVAAAGWVTWVSVTPAQHVVTSPLTYEFISGALLGIYRRRIPAPLALPLLLAGAGIALAAAVLLPAAGPATMDAWLRVALFGTSGLFLVAGAVTWETQGHLRLPAFIMRMGDYSYSLYLSHIFVISAFGRLWAEVLPTSGWAGHITFVSVAIFACCYLGDLVYIHVERPLQALPLKLGDRRGRRSSQGL